MRKVLVTIGMFRWLVASTLLLACEPIVNTFNEVEEAVYYQAAEIITSPETADTLMVMNWNIKFGGGDLNFWFDCYGDRVLMTEEEVLTNLDSLVEKIRQVDPDIILLQEVDVEAKRVAYVDQMQYLLDHTDLNYGVYISEWDTQFIASDGIGRMDGEGNGILSRWPFIEAKRIALPLRTDQDALTQYFYIRRGLLTAMVELPGYDNFHVLTIHAAAFSQDGTKKKHIDIFNEELDKIDATGGLFVAGGDLNTIPPGSQKLHDFKDSICEEEEFRGDDYQEETEWLTGLYESYHPAISLSDYQADNALYFSHSTNPRNGFTRKLDYLFTNSAWVTGSGYTHQEIVSVERALSDHAPVSAQLVLP